MPGVIGVDLVSMPKFRQQVCRRHSVDTFIDADTVSVTMINYFFRYYRFIPSECSEACLFHWWFMLGCPSAGRWCKVF